MYSGGKDSTFAIHHAIKKGWDIRYLLSIKPTRTDCFLFHFATVENTVKTAEILGLKHILAGCDVADPVKEAELVKEIILGQQKEDPVDAVVLGGTGLQETQIKSIQKALMPYKIEAFAAHAGLDHDEVMREMIEEGYEINITQYASDGLGQEFLGFKINNETLPKFIERSKQYGFHVGGEGGYYDTFVTDGPIFSKKIVFEEVEKVKEDKHSGHLVVKKLKVIDKEIKIEKRRI